MVIYEYRTTRHKVGEAPATIRMPADTLPVLRSMLDGLEQERIIALSLDCKNRVIGATVVCTGNVSAASVRVGEVFRDAVRWQASGVILAHNHPSGDPTPSPDDLHLTAECIAAGKILDIKVLDHLIVADGGSFTSLRDRGIAFGS